MHHRLGRVLPRGAGGGAARVRRLDSRDGRRLSSPRPAAGMAAREVPGIHNLGEGMARAFGATRERVPGGGAGGGVTRGVKVQVGKRQAAVDLNIVVECGVSIVDVAGDVRSNVISAVERMTGLEVVEVDIAVDDVHLPEDGEEEEESEGG
ncbi:Asp23/Gls24 family envelope stress response protein [Streptomyces sp. NPDC002328]|uniref:Asp23/Gls24 family envelope stress response protein n=1 Tax=Streptomyces sp. NPDC002328 TaxID=3364642 RepID=UPI0036C465B2